MPLPIDRISHSAFTLYLRNPYAFKRKYIDRAEDVSISPAALVGKAFHRFAELFYSGIPVEDALKAGESMIGDSASAVTDWGETGSPEKCLDEYRRVAEFYLNEGIPFPKENVLAVEKEMRHRVRGLRVDLKCIADLILQYQDVEVEKQKAKTKTKLVVVDWKVVSSFTTPETLTLTHYSQAFFNMVLAEAEYKIKPDSFVFIEIKKSKNKDGTSQVQKIVIPADDEDTNKQFDKVQNLLKLALKDIRTRKIWLANPADGMGGEESYEQWGEELTA